MKNNKALAIALSAGLVLGGGVINEAHAAEPNENNWYGGTHEDQWQEAAVQTIMFY